MEEESKINFGNNAFDWIRLIAAIQVVIGHSIIHLNISSNNYFDTIFGWFPGVVVFFSISGYLITASAERSINYIEYAKKRLLRIYPGLIACFFVTLTIVLITYDYNFNWKEIVIWTGLHTTFFQWYSPDFLRTYGTGAINGALWTIVVELQFYLFTMLFYKKMKGISINKWLVIIGIFLSINVTMPFMKSYIPSVIYGLLLETFIPYIYIYLIGAFLYTFREQLLHKLMNNFKYIVSIYVMLNVVNEFLNINIGEHYNMMTGIFLPVIVISLSYILGKRRLSADLSYGLYLYHMVIINVLVQIGLIGTFYSLIIAWILTFILALISWYLIEKRFLNKKKLIRNIAHNTAK